MVVGLDVALADGRVVHTGGAPRAAVGPDLTQLFVGSEGTLGVITGARLRLHPAPQVEQRAAFGFSSFGDGIEACRRVLHRGATPAVLRLYDATEADRSYQTGDRHVLLALDEGDNELVEGVMNVVLEECVDAGAERLDDELVGRWLEHRNDVAALEALISRGFVVDTMEVAARWRDPPADVRRGHAGDPGGRRNPGGLGAPVALLPRRGLSLFHLRRTDRARRAGGLLPGGVGRRGPEQCSPPAAPSATTTVWG